MSPVTLSQKIGAALFIIITVACWIFLSATLSDTTIGKKYIIFFQESVRGLAPSSLVCYNGIPVGKVEKLENDLHNNKVKVTVAITAEEISIFSSKKNDKKEGTKAKLVTYLMTGLQYIDLYGVGKEELTEGSTIPTVQDNLVKRLEEKFDSLSQETQKFASSLNKILSPQNIEQLSEIVKNANTISQNITIATSPEHPNGIPYRLNVVLENGSNLIGKNSELQKILNNITILTDPKKNGVVRLISDMRKEVKRTSRSVNTLLFQLNQLMDSKGRKEDMTQTIREVNLLVRENRRSIKETMSNLSILSATADQKLTLIADSANKTVITLNHFLQKELYQASAKMSILFSELTNIVQILKAKPNALLWGSKVEGK